MAERARSLWAIRQRKEEREKEEARKRSYPYVVLVGDLRICCESAEHTVDLLAARGRRMAFSWAQAGRPVVLPREE